MAIQAQPEAPTASPAPREQSITASLTAEIMHDLDDGRPTLVAYTNGDAGDLREVAATALVAKVQEARAQLDRIEELANQYAAAVTLPAFIEHYGITVIETDLDGLADIDPRLAGCFTGSADLLKDGSLVAIVPKGQPPVMRLAVIRELVLDVMAQAEQA